MSTFELDDNAFIKEAGTAMLAGVQIAHVGIVEMTPRDWNRAPQPITRKDGRTPVRNTGRGVVYKNGNWYEGVTGNLKRSISYEQKGPLEFIVGVVRGPTEEYARAQEFGTNRIPARSYLRRGLIENNKDIIRTIESVFQQLTRV